MTTDQKIRFIYGYIEAAAEARHKETKKYFLHMARGAAMAYGADGSIGTKKFSEIIAEIDKLIEEVLDATF